MLKFVKNQPVLAAAFSAALAASFVIPPDKEYIGYINYNVLIQLFSLMTAVAGLRRAGLLERATDTLLKKAGTVRRLGLLLTLLCYFSSMLVTNDVSLLTFVPLTLMVFEDIRDEKSRILTVVLETAAANLGSMLTPVGNPQNLYIYDAYKLSAADFVKTMLPAGAVSLIMLCALTLLLPKTACSPENTVQKPIDKKLCTAFSTLFAVCLLSVFRVIPALVCLVCALAAAMIFEKKLLASVDYPLLATFVCFFVFVGSIARIEAVSGFFRDVLTGRELILSALLSQLISNVPAAVMLSRFTDNGIQLMLGTDIGGLGTVIASLASLISFQFYRKSENSRPGKYMLVFSAVNFGMLAVLLLFQMMLL